MIVYLAMDWAFSPPLQVPAPAPAPTVSSTPRPQAVPPATPVVKPAPEDWLPSAQYVTPGLLSWQVSVPVQVTSPWIYRWEAVCSVHGIVRLVLMKRHIALIVT